jgi:hypothetical protein
MTQRIYEESKQDRTQAKMLLTKSVYEMSGEWNRGSEQLVLEMLEFIYEVPEKKEKKK